MSDNQQNGNKKLLLALLALLFVTNIGTLYLYLTTNKAKDVITTEKLTLENDYKNLNETLNAQIAAFEDLKGENAQLDQEIAAKQQEIEEQKKKIESLYKTGKLNAAELAKAKALIAEHEASISNLRQQVEELVAQNQQLDTENKQLASDLTAEKATTSQLSEQNKGLSQKVQLGSLLQLRNIEVIGVRKKNNGKEVEASKAKVVENLRISFETGDNKVLDAGNLSLYVRIINPKGEVISVADQGSGTLKLAGSNQDIQYTKQADFDYSQANKKVVVYWSQNINTSGTYKVEVYQSGYAIGFGQVTLK